VFDLKPQQEGDMRKLVKFWFVLVAIIIFADGLNAQQPSTIFLGNLFKEESVDLADGAAQNFKDAARRARDNLAPGQCPKTTITMSLPKGDDLFQEALLTAQRDILQGLLGSSAQSFVFNLDWKGTSPSVQIDPVTDKAAPRITVTPRSGTRMKSGRREKIQVTATEPESGWQSGIRRIQIEDVDHHTNLKIWHNQAPMPRPCANAGLTKTIEATAEVPVVPVWHLKVTVADYANNRVVEQVDYPTGDWNGRLEWRFHHREDTSIPPDSNRSETKFNGHADLAVHHDGRGRLTGTLVGIQKVDTLWWGFPHGNGEVCRGSAPSTPVRAKVEGSLGNGPNAISLQLTDVEAAITPQWSGGGPTLSCTPLKPIDNGPSISGVVRSLQPAGDGTYKIELNSSHALFESYWSMTLRPAAN
jgi:hypothetical protein